MIGIIGAICGDIIGSPFEIFDVKDRPKYDFGNLFSVKSRITDDSIHTCAVADWLMNTNRTKEELAQKLYDWTMMFPQAGYGGMFRKWIERKDFKPYFSYGNGSAMRVSPVAWVSDDESEVIRLATISAEVTHNHPEGIKGAVATAIAILHNRLGKDKEFIKKRIEELTGYDLNKKYEDIKFEKFDATCQGTVPASIICWLDSKDYEDCVRKAIALGNDTDTQACIAGSICAANKETEVTDDILVDAIKFCCFTDNKVIDTINEFNKKYIFNFQS